MSLPTHLYKIARARKFTCLDKSCPLFDLCPLKGNYPNIDKDTWLVRNCPKVQEAGSSS